MFKWLSNLNWPTDILSTSRFPVKANNPRNPCQYRISSNSCEFKTEKMMAAYFKNNPPLGRV